MASYPSPKKSRTPPAPPNGQASSTTALDAISKQPRQPLPNGRPAQPLTWVLANHAKAYLESQQYAQGFTFLNTLLTTGASISTPAKLYPAYLAPAAQLALASTIVVYPATTTKAKLPDAIKGADAAVRYLRSVHTTIHPTDETLKGAFAFGERSTRYGPRSNGESPGTESANNMERLTGLPATTNSLWELADDFWHVVGWAFNCSRVHKKRWERWRVWLELMLDFLEADWDFRIKQIKKEEDVDQEQLLLDSLLWHYITSEGPTSRTNRTRIIRAIFAMATPDSNKEFYEIWKGETLDRVPKKENDMRPITKPVSDNDEWRDQNSDDEDMVMEDAEDEIPIRASSRSPSRKSSNSSLNSTAEPEEAIDLLGGIDALNLRQRFLALLCEVPSILPDHFTDPGSFYDSSVADVFLHLPTSVFALILSTSELPGIYQTALNSNLLFPLVSAKVPNYARSEPKQSDFEHSILSARATTQTYEKNAKVSIIVERMFMFMMENQAFQSTHALRTAVEAGVNARMRVKRRNESSAEQEQAQALLEDSAKRLLGLLEILEVVAGMPPQERKRRDASAMLSSFEGLSDPPSDLTSPETSDTE